MLLEQCLGKPCGPSGDTGQRRSAAADPGAVAESRCTSRDPPQRQPPGAPGCLIHSPKEVLRAWAATEISAGAKSARYPRPYLLFRIWDGTMPRKTNRAAARAVASGDVL
jgi:hypothetical protein